MNSLLVSVVSTFEVHVANLVSQYFRDAPQALNRSDLRTSEKEFSLADIQSAQSVDDVIDMAISRRVEKLLFGSLKDWSNFFETNMGIKFEDLSINWNFVQEAVQRRHIIIHNGGYVSSRYVSLTKGLSSGVEVLDPRSLARCDEAYLSRVLDEFLALGILLAASVAMKMKVQGKSTIVHSIHDLSYEMLKRGRWVFCVHACRFGEKISEEEDMRVLFKVNRLIAQKNKGDVEPAIREAAEWDVSAAELRFKLAKMILADDSADPYPVLAKLIERKEVGLEDLLNWPLLEGVRGDRRFPWVVLYAQQKSGKSKNQGDYFFTSSKSQVVHILGCSRVGEGHTSIPVSSLFTGDFRPCVFCTSSSDEGFSVRELSS